MGLMVRADLSQALVLKFIAPKIDATPADLMPCHVLGVTSGTNLIAGIVFYHMTGHTVELAFAARDKHWITRPVLRKMFALPFDTLGVDVIRGFVREGNAHSISISERLGFKCDGRLRKFYRGEEDVLIFSMIREECQWI